MLVVYCAHHIATPRFVLFPHDFGQSFAYSTSVYYQCYRMSSLALLYFCYTQETTRLGSSLETWDEVS